MTLPAVEHLVTLDVAQRLVPVDTEALRAAAGQLRTADPALGQYTRALGLARTHAPDRADFALQHLGKHHIDAGEPDLARACLTEALRLRNAKGDPVLIASTRAALRLLDA